MGRHAPRQASHRPVLRNMVDASLQGTIREIWMGGPPWALTLVARFDDQAPDRTATCSTATGPCSSYAPAGRINEQDDFYEDTSRIESLEARLRELDLSRA